MNRERELVTLLEEFAIMHRDELEAGEIFTLGTAAGIVRGRTNIEPPKAIAPPRIVPPPVTDEQIMRRADASPRASFVDRRKRDFLDRACPTCGARAEEHCVTPAGQRAQQSHLMRGRFAPGVVDHECPYCEAKAGERCKQSSGIPSTTGYHALRTDETVRETISVACPVCHVEPGKLCVNLGSDVRLSYLHHPRQVAARARKRA